MALDEKNKNDHFQTFYAQVCLMKGYLFGPFPGKDAMDDNSQYMTLFGRTDDKNEANLFVVSDATGNVFYKACKNIPPFKPLLVWTGASILNESKSNLPKRSSDKTIKMCECPICPAKFFAKRNLQVHRKTHTREEFKCHEERQSSRFICEDCGQVYPNPQRLTGHRNICSKATSWICGICSITFYDKSDFLSHKNVHELSLLPKWQCDICLTRFPTLELFNDHRIVFQNEVINIGIFVVKAEEVLFRSGDVII